MRSRCARSSAHRRRSPTPQATQVSSRDLQSARSRVSSVAVNVSVTAYRISNIEEIINTTVIDSSRTSRILDALQKKCLLHEPAHRTKTIARKKERRFDLYSHGDNV